jgi:hypothetical protein
MTTEKLPKTRPSNGDIFKTLVRVRDNVEALDDVVGDATGIGRTTVAKLDDAIGYANRVLADLRLLRESISE